MSKIYTFREYWLGYITYYHRYGLDVWDPIDDIPTGATELFPANKIKTNAVHMISTINTNDWFKIYMTNGYVYNFNSTLSTNTSIILAKLYSDTNANHLMEENQIQKKGCSGRVSRCLIPALLADESGKNIDLARLVLGHAVGHFLDVMTGFFIG